MIFNYYSITDKWNLSKPTTFNSKNSEDKTINVWLGVDAEFQTGMNCKNKIITVQIENVVLEHPLLNLNLASTWSGECAISEVLGLTDEIAQYPTRHEKRLIAHLGIFFSPTDIIALFRNENIIIPILKKLDQKRNITTEKNQPIFTGLKLINTEGFSRHLFINIHDASALMGNLSLKELAKSLQVDMESKDYLTQKDKEQMLLTYKNKTDIFLEYARGDSKIINVIFNKYNKLWEDIQNDIGIDKFMPYYTVGTNVATTTKLLITRNLKRKTNTSELEIINKIAPIIQTDRISNFQDLVIYLNREATAKYLANDVRYTSQYGAMTDGGRCKSERPRDTNVKGLVADIDISGCYGNGLLNQIYPVGIPTILKFRKDQPNQRITLGDLIKQYERNLVPGLWYARISTIEPLSFEQDLLISKIPPNKITATSSDDLTQDESEEILGTFILLTKEIKCAVLTHDLLQVLRNCATANEWSELKRKIVIETIIFYPLSLECQTMDEWGNKFSKEDKGVKNWIGKNFSIHENDERSRHWIALQMNEEWMDIILGNRNNYAKDNPLNKGYKLLGNSTYGVQASIYFDIGNVVVANNITARARTLSWMMAKSLGTYQSITDGGCFNLNAVNNWHNTKPGINTLTNINERSKLARRTREKLSNIPLGSCEWKLKGLDENGKTVLIWNNEEIVGSKEKWDLIDKLAWEHISNFFPADIDILRKQGIQIKGYDNVNKKVESEITQGQFTFQTKDVYIKASFQSQANYRLVHPDGTEIVKARGYETEKQLYLDKYGNEPYDLIPIKDCLTRIANGEDIPPYPPTYNATVLKIKAWQNPNKTVEEHNLLPGDTTSRRSHLRPISLSMFRWQTWRQYERWSKRHEDWRNEYGYGVEAYFLNSDSSVRYGEAVKKIQDAIDEGKDWVSDINQPPQNIKHPFV